MKPALVAYLSCIAAVLNFEATTNNSNTSREKPTSPSHLVKIQVEVDEVGSYNGQENPPKKYTRTLPAPGGSQGTVEVGLQPFLKKFSRMPVAVHEACEEPTTIRSMMSRKTGSNIKTAYAKNKELRAKMTAELVDKEGVPQNYKRYKRNMAARAGYFVAATVTSAVLIPIGVIASPVIIWICCIECLNSNDDDDSDCEGSSTMCEIIIKPQYYLWSKVFSNKTNRRINVVTR